MESRRYAFKSPVKRFLVSCLDAFGGLLFFPLRHRQAPRTFKKILAVRIDHLGDVLMARPALQLLPGLYPDAEIHLLCAPESASLLKEDSCAHRLIVFGANWFSRRTRPLAILKNAFRICRELRQERYDLAVEFRGDFRTILLLALAGIPYRIGYGTTGGGFLLHKSTVYPWKIHQVEANVRLLEALAPAVSSRGISVAKLSANAGRVSFYKKLLKDPGSRLPVLIIHAGAGYPSKKWPDENFSRLITRLSEENAAKIVLIGTREEKAGALHANPSGNVLDLRGETTLEDLPALFESCDLYVGNDSGPAHLAAAKGLRVVSIFSGTNDPGIWRPWGENVSLIRHAVPCAPCEAQICPLSHHDCMRKISVEEVYRVVIKHLNEGKLS